MVDLMLVGAGCQNIQLLVLLAESLVGNGQLVLGNPSNLFLLTLVLLSEEPHSLQTALLSSLFCFGCL